MVRGRCAHNAHSSEAGCAYHLANTVGDCRPLCCQYVKPIAARQWQPKARLFPGPWFRYSRFVDDRRCLDLRGLAYQLSLHSSVYVLTTPPESTSAVFQCEGDRSSFVNANHQTKASADSQVAAVSQECIILRELVRPSPTC